MVKHTETSVNGHSPSESFTYFSLAISKLRSLSVTSENIRKPGIDFSSK